MPLRESFGHIGGGIPHQQVFFECSPQEKSPLYPSDLGALRKPHSIRIQKNIRQQYQADNIICRVLAAVTTIVLAVFRN